MRLAKTSNTWTTDKADFKPVWWRRKAFRPGSANPETGSTGTPGLILKILFILSNHSGEPIKYVATPITLFWLRLRRLKRLSCLYLGTSKK